MIIRTESDMMDLGRKFATSAELPVVYELIGDVGAGKTTFTRGLAEGLGVGEPITSPSFTLSKRYAFTSSGSRPGELMHYDFYRLSDPGLMREDLAEALSQPNSVVVVEWGGDVADLLPADKLQLRINLLEDGSREIIMNPLAERILASKSQNANQQETNKPAPEDTL